MEIAIGIQFSSREIRLEVDDDVADVRERVEEAFRSEPGILWLTDRDGRDIGIPTEKLAYVELGSDKATKSVGFAVSVEQSKG